MAEAEKLLFMKPAEYIEFEKKAEHRHEFVNGLITAMAGASRQHNLLTLAFASMLRAHLRGSGCHVFASDMKVDASHKGNALFYYPDIMVSCTRDHSNKFVETNPLVIAEVLFPTTEARDRIEKLRAYTSIPGLQEYILVSQDKIAIDLYQKIGNDWEIHRLNGEQQELHLASIDYTAKLKEIYEDIMDVL